MRKLTRTLFIIPLIIAVACSDGGKDPEGPGPTDTAVATITVTPASVTLGIGSTRALSAVATNAAGNPVTATITWQTSSASVATVDATGTVTARAAGTANITASSGNVQSAAVVVTVTGGAPWPTTGASSGKLIDAAIRQGTLTAEQGLVYKVFAAFFDQRLPVAYRGIGESGVDNPILMEAADRFPTLSTATQALLAPFFIPPPNAGSWYAARRPGSSPPSSAAAANNTAACNFQSWHQSVTTAHFRIHYDIWGGGNLWDQAAIATRDILVAEAEKVWSAETRAFGREPLLDGGVTTECNGGDALIDIYILNMAAFEASQGEHVKAIADPYVKGTCEKTPSKIMVPGNGDAKELRNALAHEFFHVLELGSYNRAANCFREYYWLGEATGNWAMDLVYGDPKDQYEHGWAAHYMDWERLVPLDEAYGNDTDKTNGYCDYVFLLYLSRKFNGTSVIKDIWDASESANSVTAIVNALASRGGIDKVWPDFALALWNDVGAANQDDFKKWDELEWGMKKIFDLVDSGQEFGTFSIEVDQKGTPKKKFELLTTTLKDGGGYELPRLSVHVDYLKFKDANVSSVLYLNAMSLATDIPQFKIQALVKKGGSWLPAADWTKAPYKTFCRDLRDERIEELVLIYSNSDGRRPSTGLPFMFLPRVNVSNVGCAKWEGTSSIETVITGPAGGSSKVTAANLVFEREPRLPELPDGGSGFETFRIKAGQISATSTANCLTLTAQGGVIADDGMLTTNFDTQDFGTFAPPPNRHIVAGTGMSFLVTESIHCMLGLITGQNHWEWLAIPVLGASAVSADGRTIQGDTTMSLAGNGTKTMRWKFTAVREQ